jgi:hypothetical protein
MMINIKAKISWMLSSDQPKREVRFDGSGFTILDGKKEPVIGSWAMVKEVFAFKQDRITFDDICIGFRFSNDGSYWWVAEDYVGFEDFHQEVKRKFPGITQNWLAEVATPPFAENRTTLWGEKWEPTRT